MICWLIKYTEDFYFHFLNLITSLQLKSKDARIPRSHFPDAGCCAWKQWRIMRNNWQRWRNEPFLQTNAVIQLWKRPYCPQWQSFGAGCQASILYNTTEMLQGSIGNAFQTFHSSCQSGFECHDWEKKWAFVLRHDKKLKRFESILKFPKIWTTELRKSPGQTTKEEVDHRRAGIISTGEVADMFYNDAQCYCSLFSLFDQHSNIWKERISKCAKLKWYILPLSYTCSLG